LHTTLLLLYCCFTAALLYLSTHERNNLCIPLAISSVVFIFTAAVLLLYCCFTAALLLLYCCFAAALLYLTHERNNLCIPLYCCFTALLLLYCT
jgi:hypothetical protein